MNQTITCEICFSKLKKMFPILDEKGEFFECTCPKCGTYTINQDGINELRLRNLNDNNRLKITYTTRKSYEIDGRVLKLTPEKINRIIKTDLPSIKDQADLIIKWVGIKTDADLNKDVIVREMDCFIFGMKNTRSLSEIIGNLKNKKDLLKNVKQQTYLSNDVNKPIISHSIALTYDGVEAFEELKNSLDKKQKKEGLILKTAFNESYIIYKSNRIGEGGSGVVYRSEGLDGKEVVIKCLHEKASPQTLNRFKNEINFCFKSSHPNVISVIDFGPSDMGPFYVMPPYESSLKPHIGRLKKDEILIIFNKILDGVGFAHDRNIIHRDLKPENILIKEKGKEVVVADFGIAHFQEEDLLLAVETRNGERLANFQFAAPEQKIKGRVVDKTADIYALGLILNHLFTTDIPQGHGYRTIASFDKSASYLDPIVEKMINQLPENRYQTIEEIKRELTVKCNGQES